MFARARPEKLSITETYAYDQVLSVNPEIGAAAQQPRSGKVEMVVPFDGRQYFTRDAIRDVQAQAGESDKSMPTTVLATIGHLALLNVGDTKRFDGSPLVGPHDVIPLRVMVRSPGSDSDASEAIDDDVLASDAREWAAHIDYIPSPPAGHSYPLKLDVKVLDPEDVAPLPPGFRLASSRDVGRITRQPAFSSELTIQFQLHLIWPRRLGKAEPKASIKRVSVSWPTMTSLEPSALRFKIGKVKTEIQYDPSTASLEWLGVGLESGDRDAPEEDGPDEKGAQGAEDASDHGGVDAGKQPSEPEPAGAAHPDAAAADDDEDEEIDDAAAWHLYSKVMRLDVRQPGQLRRQPNLDGTIEVEVEGELMSGIEARLFNATGNRPRRHGVGVKTKLVLGFHVALEDLFGRRKVTASHSMHFDEIIPDERRIDDIVAVLRDRGFDCETGVLDDDAEEPSWYIDATRVEGPNEIYLGIVVRGRRHLTQRRTGSPGWHRFISDMPSGEIMMSIYGQVPRNSRELTTEVNELRKALTGRFQRVRAQR